MKSDERAFFKVCFKLTEEGYTLRDISYNLLDLIPLKRQLYLVSKWVRLGFYNYNHGINIFCGWFEPDKLPERYIELLKERDSQ